jgi:hypothetical protein
MKDTARITVSAKAVDPKAAIIAGGGYVHFAALLYYERCSKPSAMQ